MSFSATHHPRVKTSQHSRTIRAPRKQWGCRSTPRRYPLSPNPAPADQRQPKQVWYSSTRMPLILVVDDNQELLVLMTRLFEQAGYQAISASRGVQGGESGRSKAPDR